MNVSVCGVFRHYVLHDVSCCFIFLLLRNVILSCFVENKLIYACSIQNNSLSLYQQLKTTTL